MCFGMKEILKLLRETLRRWNVEVFGVVNLEVEQAIIELNFLDLATSYQVDKEDGGILVKRESRLQVNSKQIRNFHNFMRQKSRFRYIRK